MQHYYTENNSNFPKLIGKWLHKRTLKIKQKNQHISYSFLNWLFRQQGAIVVIKQVKVIQFVHLSLPRIPHLLFTLHKITYLDLNNNFICNIETLSKYDMPLLSQLLLRNNLITSIRALRKCSFRLLVTLDLSNNHILDFGSLTEANFVFLQKIIIPQILLSRFYPKNEATTLKSQQIHKTVLKGDFPSLQLLKISHKYLTTEYPLEYMLDSKYKALFTHDQFLI